MGSMEAVFLRLLNMSLSACWLILAVVLLRLMLPVDSKISLFPCCLRLIM